MEATFKLNGYHTLRINTDVPRRSGDGSVGFQVECTPISLPGDPVSSETFGERCASGTDLPVPPGNRILMSQNLKPSEARAIASALLSAATEGRK